VCPFYHHFVSRFSTFPYPFSIAQHSIKHLLLLTSIIILGFGPRWDSQPNLCSFQDHCVFGNGVCYCFMRGEVHLSK
jgi:hypothetical protein